MPRHGRMHVEEKSKDFKGSLIRLFKNMDKWKSLLIISIILSFFSALLSTIAPNKLSSLTNVISDGIKPNTEKLEIISKKIISSFVSTPSSISSDPSILMKNLSDEEKMKYLEEFQIDNSIITVDDQIQFIHLLNDTSEKNYLNQLDKLPNSIKKIVEPKLDKNALHKKSLVLAIIYLLGSIFSYIQGLVMAYVSNGYSKSLRTNISKKINRLPLKYFDNHETGDILSRVTNDIDTIGMSMNQSISGLVSNLTLFIGSIIMMFVTNWVMALTAIFSSILGFVLSFLLLKKSQKYFVERQKQLGALNGHIEEIYSGHTVVKAYNGEKEALEEFEKINTKLFDSNRKSQFLSGIMQPIMGFIGNIGYVAVCVVGSILVMKGYASFGVIVAFMIYVRLFTNPLSQIAQALTSMQSTVAAAERVFEFLDEEELSREDNIKGYVDAKKAKGNIEFKNVQFSYNKDKVIIKDFNAKIKAGSKVALVGPTGAGKTTMVNLLMKFYEIDKGDILIDGESIKNLTRENIHDLFVMVLQDTWLFDGTIEENIRFNQKHITKNELWDICKSVGVDHFIKTLPGELNCQVGDNEAISSGQKQLLTIARGMSEKAPFLILDEATSNVDTRTEELVQKAMDKLMEGKTSFIIAHRLSTIKNADLILVLNEGDIIEQGTHEELLKKNGFYANLYNSQFQK